MSFLSLLLRCLLALALVAGGVPSVAMAGVHDHGNIVEAQPSGMPSCHDIDGGGAEPSAAGATDADCCGGASCQCDCLQHMPVVALVLQGMEIAVLPAPAPAGSLPSGHGPTGSNSLRPPIA